MRKRRKRSDLIIDVTSLLDVIFIILLVVVCNNRILQDQLLAQQQGVEQIVNEAKDVTSLYNDYMQTESSIQEYVSVISIIVPYEPDNVVERHIKVLKEDEVIETFDLLGNDTEEAFFNFKESLTAYIKSAEKHPVIISLNEKDEKMLYRDEVKIKKILFELTDELNNAYIK